MSNPVESDFGAPPPAPIPTADKRGIIAAVAALLLLVGVVVGYMMTRPMGAPEFSLHVIEGGLEVDGKSTLKFDGEGVIRIEASARSGSRTDVYAKVLAGIDGKPLAPVEANIERGDGGSLIVVGRALNWFGPDPGMGVVRIALSHDEARVQKLRGFDEPLAGISWITAAVEYSGKPAKKPAK